MANLIPFRKSLTHKQRVCGLYKRILRNLESWYYVRPVFRFQAVMMRAKFDENKNLTDENKIEQLIEAAEEELVLATHVFPKMFGNSIGGGCYGREAVIPDSVLDYWHPFEKARFPEYFKRREQRKKEYIAMWEKTYGPYNPETDH